MKKKTNLILISFIFLNTFFSFAQKSEKYLNIQATIIRYNNNDCKGAIEIVALEGNQPFEYSIDAGKTFLSNNVFENLCEGKYFIQVKDASGKLGLTMVDLITPIQENSYSEEEQEIIKQNKIKELLSERASVMDDWEKRRVVEYELSKLHVVFPPMILTDIKKDGTRELSFKMLIPEDVTSEKVEQFVDRIINRYSGFILDIDIKENEWVATINLIVDVSDEVLNDIFQRFSFSGFQSN